MRRLVRQEPVRWTPDRRSSPACCSANTHQCSTGPRTRILFLRSRQHFLKLPGCNAVYRPDERPVVDTDNYQNAPYGSGRAKRRQPHSLSQFFINRQSESDAFMESIWARDHDLQQGNISEDSFDNILLYYGFSGLGKTQLSLGLQDWIESRAPSDGRRVGATHQWGVPPRPDRPIVTARWDLFDSGGNLDPLPLLLSIRVALRSRNSKKLPHKLWRAFDVAFSAYLGQVQPGRKYDSSNPRSQYVQELPKLLGELAIEATVDVGAGVGAQVLHDVAQSVLNAVRQRRTLTEYPHLADLIERCLDAEPGSTKAGLAADLLFLIDMAIQRTEPEKRPLVIVFVDHVERVQASQDARAGEKLLNELTGALPHALFVMTGQNSLDWYRSERVNLEHRGRHVWPCLQPNRTKNPRPHLLDTLSETHAISWIRRQAKETGLNFDQGVVENLVSTTGRWPVHIDAVFALAQTKVEEGVELLTIEDLDGSFEDVVRRLLSDLPHDERTALQAACLLPYFDADFVHSVTPLNVTSASIQRLTKRTIVLDNVGSRYPYRVHDEIRRAVRAAGPFIAGGWDDTDWRAHATTALERALFLARKARQARDNDENLAATGLAITIAAEHGVSVSDSEDPNTDGLVMARRGSPSNSGLLPLIPSSDSVAHPDTHALIRLVEIISGDVTETSVKALEALATSPSPSTTDVLVWRGYRLRETGRCTDAAELFAWLRDNAPDKAQQKRRRLYARHVGVSYSVGRRFRDAAEAMPLMDADQATRNRLADLALHGHISDPYFENLKAQIPEAPPRYALELEGMLHNWTARAGRLDRVAADALLEQAIRFGHKPAERLARTACALDDIVHGRDFDSTNAGTLNSHRSLARMGEILAFKALRDGPDEAFSNWLQTATAVEWRERAWIPTEMLLDHLGCPLNIVETQWLEPAADVRARWISIYRNLLGPAF